MYMVVCVSFQVLLLLRAIFFQLKNKAIFFALILANVIDNLGMHISSYSIARWSGLDALHEVICGSLFPMMVNLSLVMIVCL